MSHSVVKVTETPINDSLVLIIDKDGYITPDRKTLQDYLEKQTGETEIPFMQVNKTEGKMEVTCGSLQYLSSHDEEGFNNEIDINEIERNLMSFRMDHDYTPLTCTAIISSGKELAEIDELAETLSILEGSNEIAASEKQEVLASKVTRPFETKTTKKVPNMQPLTKRKAVQQKPVIKTSSKLKNNKLKLEDEFEEDNEAEEDEDDDQSMDSEELNDDVNDSDYEIDEPQKIKSPKKVSRATKQKSLTEKKPMKTIRTIKPLLTRHGAEPKVIPPLIKPIEKRLEVATEVKVSPEKKSIPKKEKKAPKPIPDDFALFSTPDIIRRVGGKNDTSAPCTPTTPNTPESPKYIKPDRIFHGQLTKSPSERNSVDSKSKRLSVDGKLVPSETDSVKQPASTSSELLKRKDRRHSLDVRKPPSIIHTYGPAKTGSNVTVQSFDESLGGTSNESLELEPMPSAEDIRAIIQNEDTKTFTSSLVIPDPPMHVETQPQINLDNTGLDLDQSLLDNINSDLIPEDILYQVAQSLVGNAELQNAIDKSLVDGNLVLDAPDQHTMTPDNLSILPPTTLSQNVVESPSTHVIKGTPVMRSGGRMVVIPPIERPTTRSRNKHKQDIANTPKTNKALDDEHVSGGELDSSSDGEKSDDDDPDKLWCICNQPHNNRFMICCDSCEEWYHGKCVNVTKAMGHMMEVKGREWICLYCKDKSLSRPAAAARRIRKGSHASSTDTPVEKKEKPTIVSLVGESVTPVPGCLVCGKPCRTNSIYCSDPCILKHAKVVEKVVVFERSSGTIYTGSSAPTTTNLDKWLQQHPGFEVVRSANANKPVTTKQVPHSKLKTIKNVENTEPASPSVNLRKNVNILRNSKPDPPQQQQQQEPSQPPNKPQVTTFKIVSKQIATPSKTKLIQPPPLVKSPIIVSSTPSKPKQTPTPAKTPTLAKTPTSSVKTPTSSVKTPTSSVKTPTPVKTSTPVKTPTPVVKISTLAPSKEKVVPQKTQKSKQSDESMVQSSQPENIRDNVKKTLFEQLTTRLNLADDIKLTKDELTRISSEIESQLYKCFGDTGQKYRNKYRSLIFNIKDIKNQTLWRRICEKSINAYQLVRLSPDDLASQELALWRERENKHQLEMITKSELEQLGRNRQYVFKTHKGEQVLEDNRPSDAVDNTEVVMTLKGDDGSAESTPDSKKDAKAKDKKGSRYSRSDKHDKQNRDRERSSRRDRKRDRRSSSKDKGHRKRSRSKESSRYSDKHRSNSKERDRHHRSTHKSSRHKKDIQSATEKLDKRSKEILEQLVDNKIVPPLEDTLWKYVQHEDITPAPVVESDSDHEPTSTVTIPTPPRVGTDTEEPDDTPPSITEDTKLKDDSDDEGNAYMKDVGDPSSSSIDDIGQSPSPPRFKSDYIWKGTINMVDVAQISITAHEVSGDCFGLGEELPSCLDVVGRISPETVWDYIGKMKCSNSKAISLLRLNATNIEEKMPYIALYSYLSSRNRLGVVKSTNKAVKDFYILPLASQKPLPQSLLPLNGPGFEESRPALLLGIIVRDKRKRPLFVSNSPPISKRTKLDPIIQPSALDRSYTPPPNCDSRSNLSSSPKNKDDTNDEDEPYTPEDSDPDSAPSTNNDSVSSNINSTDLSKLLTNTSKASSFLETTHTAQTFEPFSNKFDTIPGLDESAPLPANSKEIERKMEELEQRIAIQKAEIQNMSQDIASSTTSSIGTNVLASIALPQNLQQILNSIKGIHTGGEAESPQAVQHGDKALPSSDLTIPLMLPKISARSQLPPPVAPVSSTTIPLNLPKSKTKFSSINSPQLVNKKSDEKTTSVLSSLSEEELIRKAAEMLGETDDSSSKLKPLDPSSSPQKSASTGLFGSNFVPPLSSKNIHLDLEQPPIPGLD